jgi:hypothetical protein
VKLKVVVRNLEEWLERKISDLFPSLSQEEGMVNTGNLVILPLDM